MHSFLADAAIGLFLLFCYHGGHSVQQSLQTVAPRASLMVYTQSFRQLCLAVCVGGCWKTSDFFCLLRVAHAHGVEPQPSLVDVVVWSAARRWLPNGVWALLEPVAAHFRKWGSMNVSWSFLHCDAKKKDCKCFTRPSGRRRK